MISRNMDQTFLTGDGLKSEPIKNKSQNILLLEETALLGIVITGAALLEVAFLPGVLIGGAAILAPKYLNRGRNAFPHLSLNFKSKNNNKNKRGLHSIKRFDQSNFKSNAVFGVKKTVAKTVTFRILSSSLDFTWNYLLLEDIAVAAGLSGFGLIASTTFYFIHEASWNQIKKFSANGSTKALPINRINEASVDKRYWWDLQISPALAKTFTFRSMATIAEFSTNYYVVRDIPMAAALSAFGIICGPFVYYAHEKLWEKYSQKNESEIILVNNMIAHPIS